MKGYIQVYTGDGKEKRQLPLAWQSAPSEPGIVYALSSS